MPPQDSADWTDSDPAFMIQDTSSTDGSRSAPGGLPRRSKRQIDYGSKGASGRLAAVRQSRSLKQKADVVPETDPPDQASDLEAGGSDTTAVPVTRSATAAKDNTRAKPERPLDKQPVAVEEDEEEFGDDQVESSIRVDLFDPADDNVVEDKEADAKPPFATDSISHSLAARNRQRNVKILEEQGILELVCTVLDTDLDADDAKTVDGLGGRAIRSAAIELGLTMHSCVLRSIVAGTLARDVLIDPNVKDAVRKMRYETNNDNKCRPAHYINLLVDGQGRSPTPNQLLAALAEMKQYICDKTEAANRRAYNIDCLRNPKPAPVLSRRKYWQRKYLNNGKDKRSLSRDGHFAAFEAALKKRLKAIPVHLRDLPLEHPLAELGYTHKSERRLAAHRNHTDSTFLMNLMEAVLSLLYPGKFSIGQFVIFLCSQPEQGPIGELLFSLLVQAYTRTGGGFNYYPAGRSVQSAYQLTDNDWDQCWQWQKRNIDIRGNRQRETALRIQMGSVEIEHEDSEPQQEDAELSDEDHVDETVQTLVEWLDYCVKEQVTVEPADRSWHNWQSKLQEVGERLLSQQSDQ